MLANPARSLVFSVFYHTEPAGSPFQWAWEPSILIGLALWIGGYYLITGPLRARMHLPAVGPWRKTAFYLASAVVFFALVSPLDALSDEYLFSAHMFQHLLLMLVAPPLWLIGLPDGLVDRIVPPRLRPVTRFFSQPVVAFLFFNLVMGAWHLPGPYDAALDNEQIHVIEHLSFMFAGWIGWWPVLGRSEQAAPPARPPVQIFYLFFMMFPMTMLAALLTFARTPVYPFYAEAPRVWGWSVMDDQQVAGLLMWIPGNMIYFIPVAFIFFKWMGREDETGDVLSDWDFPVAGGDEPPGNPGIRPPAQDRKRSYTVKS